MAADGTAKTSISQTLVLFILPACILGILALAMFFDFLGTQATEIAKLINGWRSPVESGLLGSLGFMRPVDPAVTVTCAHYLPRIGLFFFLVAGLAHDRQCGHAEAVRDRAQRGSALSHRRN